MSTEEENLLLGQAQSFIEQMYRDQQQIFRDQMRIDQDHVEAVEQANQDRIARRYADPDWMEREARRRAKQELERAGQFDVARLIEGT